MSEGTFWGVFLLGFLGIMVILFLAAAVLSVLQYLFGSLGAYTIAKRRGIHHPWLAWVPFGNYWILGCIADQYRYVVKGKTTNRRKILLILGIVSLVAMTITEVGNLIDLLPEFEELLDPDRVSAEVSFTRWNPAIGVLYLFSALASAALAFLRHMSLFDLYRSCDPKKGELYLILGIIVPFLPAFFLFFCREKDLGMPGGSPGPKAPLPPPPRVYRETWDQ